ncbi:MAG: hypothetical protein DHS20C10_00690 [marine bacterium B5-7]|nr:MAG: hypothetical protein DHS20C10_00690 [marine bacterium B5-7]
MHSLLLFSKGIAIGLAVAVPIGPTAIFCLNIAIRHGFSRSFLAGLGASCAITLFAGIAGFGFTVIADYLLHHKLVLRGVGGSILMLIGIQLLLAKAQTEAATTQQQQGHWRAFFATFLLTITNPMMIVLFLASFASLGLLSTHNPHQAALAVVSGVFTGAFGWWTIFTGAISATRQKLPTWLVAWSNRVSGLVLLGFAAASLLTLL